MATNAAAAASSSPSSAVAARASASAGARPAARAGAASSSPGPRRSSVTGVSGATTVRGAEGHQRARQTEQRPAGGTRRRGDVARREHQRPRASRRTARGRRRSAGLGQPQRREQRVVGPIRAVAREVGEVDVPDGVEALLRRRRRTVRIVAPRCNPASVATSASAWARSGPATSNARRCGCARRVAMTQAVSDGVTDTGRPRRSARIPQGRPWRTPVGTMSNGRQDRRTRAGSSFSGARRRWRRASWPRRLGSRRSLITVESVQGHGAAVDVRHQAIDRTEVVQRRPPADDRHGVECAVDVGVGEQGAVAEGTQRLVERHVGRGPPCRRPADVVPDRPLQDRPLALELVAPGRPRRPRRAPGR